MCLKIMATHGALLQQEILYGILLQVIVQGNIWQLHLVMGSLIRPTTMVPLGIEVQRLMQFGMLLQAIVLANI
jgi:hypothetical protein